MKIKYTEYVSGINLMSRNQSSLKQSAVVDSDGCKKDLVVRTGYRLDRLHLIWNSRTYCAKIYFLWRNGSKCFHKKFSFSYLENMHWKCACLIDIWISGSQTETKPALLSLGVSVLQQSVLPLIVTIMHQSVLPLALDVFAKVAPTALDVSVWQQTVLPCRNLSTAAYAALDMYVLQ